MKVGDIVQLVKCNDAYVEWQFDLFIVSELRPDNDNIVQLIGTNDKTDRLAVYRWRVLELSKDTNLVRLVYEV